MKQQRDSECKVNEFTLHLLSCYDDKVVDVLFASTRKLSLNILGTIAAVEKSTSVG